MRRRTVKLIFIVLMIFLPLQYAVVGWVGLQKSEPWPALVLPAFKSVFDANDKITVDQVKFYLENNENANGFEIEPATLFSGVPDSQLQGFFRTHFSDSTAIAAYSNETRQWLMKKINEQYPNYSPGVLQIQWKQKICDASSVSQADPQTKIVKQFSIPLFGE